MAHNKVKKLTTHDLAFGIGCKATSEELKELMSGAVGNGKDIELVRAEIKESLMEKCKKSSQKSINKLPVSDWIKFLSQGTTVSLLVNLQ